MKRKVFRSMIRRDNEIGIKEHDGFEVEIRERTCNVYRNEYGEVHIVDPATGRSFFCIHSAETQEMDAAKAAVKELCKEGISLHKFLEIIKTEKYKTFVDIFDALELAWELERETENV